MHAAGPGIGKHKAKRPAEALPVITAAINDPSTDRLVDAADLYALRGAIHFQMGNYEAALKDEKQASGIFRCYTFSGFEADVLAAMGRHAEAAKKFMEAWNGMYNIPEYAEKSGVELAKAGNIMEALDRYNLAGYQVTRGDSSERDEEAATRMRLAVKQLLEKVTPEQIQELSEGTSAMAPSFVASIILEQRILLRKPPAPIDLSKIF